MEKLESIELLRAIDMGLNVGTLKINTWINFHKYTYDLKLAKNYEKRQTVNFIKISTN